LAASFISSGAQNYFSDVLTVENVPLRLVPDAGFDVVAHRSRLAHYETCSASTVPKFGPVVPLGASDLPFWIFRFIIAEALKTTARRGKIGASTPVFGFRPMRWPFSRTVNDPNDDNFTISHRAMVSTISFNTRSTKADDSVRVKPSFVR
jgi:hypothetical protein